jgi:hypothetical protein
MIRQRCSILCMAYRFALEEMNSSRWVEDCSTKALAYGSQMGLEAAAKNPRTVAGWNILLRANREHFPFPYPNILKKNPLPELLEYFLEEITAPWYSYCIEKLADLTVETARNHLVSTLIPSAVVESTITSGCGNEDNNNAHTDEQEGGGQSSSSTNTIRDCLLQDYIERPISISTTLRWLRRLGFTYDTRKKIFFVDGHKRPNVVFKAAERVLLSILDQA